MASCIARFVGFGIEHTPVYRLPRSRGGKRLVCRKVATIEIDFIPPSEEVKLPPAGWTKLDEAAEKQLRIPYLRGCAERMRTPSEEGFQTWIVEGFSPLTEEEIILLKGEVELCDSMLKRRIPEAEKTEWVERRCSALTQLGGDPQKGGVQ